jgi:hypothetical protein
MVVFSCNLRILLSDRVMMAEVLVSVGVVQLFTGILECHVAVATATAVEALGVVEC